MALFIFFSSYSMQQPVKDDAEESGKNLSEKEFEEKFHELFNNPEDEEKAGVVLAKAQAQINYQNELYAKGEAHFKEGMYKYMYKC